MKHDTAAGMKVDLRTYAIVTGAYWADTVVDGATRLLVLFHFYNLGYSPFELASLFLFYEIFGIVTNLVGGWVAATAGVADDAAGRAEHADAWRSACWRSRRSRGWSSRT